MYTDRNGYEFEVSWVDAWIDLTKIIYDASHWFKDCYSRQEHNAYTFWLFINHYQTISNYMINLVPNVLAYAMYYTDWAARIEDLSSREGTELELWYVYAVITRKLLLFDYIPDRHNKDLEPLDFFADSEDEDEEEDAKEKEKEDEEN